MFAYALFPIVLYIPLVVFKYMKNSILLPCTYKFTLDTDLNKWDSFVLQFNRSDYPEKTHKFLSVIDDYIQNEVFLKYTNITITEDFINVIVKNDSEDSFEEVMKIIDDDRFHFDTSCSEEMFVKQYEENVCSSRDSSDDGSETKDTAQITKEKMCYMVEDDYTVIGTREEIQNDYVGNEVVKRKNE